MALSKNQVEDLTNIFARLTPDGVWAIPVWLGNMRAACALSPMRTFYVIDWSKR